MMTPAATYRATLPAAALLLAAWMPGCNGTSISPGADVAPPITPGPDANLPEQWYRGWETEQDVLAGSEVDDMFFILGTRGRDWREPDGPDGYPVRVCLLNGLGQPIRADGGLQAFLVHAPADPHSNKALYAWSVPPDLARRRFRKDKIPGYLLQLDWGANPPQAGGDFMLVIRWTSTDQRHRVTRNIVFKDRIRHAIEPTTTRPRAP